MSKSKYITRLKRSEGQLRGIQKMIEEERDCMDIMIQLSAVRSSVDRVIELLITDNIMECINNPTENPEEHKERIEKAIQYLVKKKYYTKLVIKVLIQNYFEPRLLFFLIYINLIENFNLVIVGCFFTNWLFNSLFCFSRPVIHTTLDIYNIESLCIKKIICFS